MYEVRVVKKKLLTYIRYIYKYLILIFIRIENSRVEFLWRRWRILDRHKYRRLLRDINSTEYWVHNKTREYMNK
jgi:hypothetical protein